MIVIVVYLAPVSWLSIAQRPHFFAQDCLEKGASKVYWIEPIPSRFPKKSDFRTKILGVEPASITPPQGLEMIRSGVFFPVEPFPKLFKVINYFQIRRLLASVEQIKARHQQDKIILVAGKPSQLALALLNRYSFDGTVADIMDDFPYFFTGRARTAMQVMMQQVMRQVDTTWFSSHPLQEKYQGLTQQNQIILNACSLSFAVAVNQAVNQQENQSEHQATQLSSRPTKTDRQDSVTYGYIGSINHWFDWAFVLRLAKEKPKATIVLIGPCYVALPLLPENVKMKPAVEHQAVPKLLSQFDYGIIPFKINALTSSVDPVKYYEYLAAGLPVISTAFGEMKSRIAAGFAIDLTQHLSGEKIVAQESLVTWDQRFPDIN